MLQGRIFDCTKKIVSAHSLQRMGALTRLEADVNGNQMLYTLADTQINPDTQRLELKPIGKKSASTFFGFCSQHDSMIFQPIEQNPEEIDLDSDETCFLLSFKAFAIMYHRKKEELNLLSKTDPDLKRSIIIRYQ